MEKAIKKNAKALEATTAVKRGSNIMAVIKADAAELGKKIETSLYQADEFRLQLGEMFRDRIVAGDICAHAVEGDNDAKKAAKDRNQAEADMFVKAAFPKLRDKSIDVRRGELLSFAKPHVVEHTPDYRGVFKTWCASTTSKDRGGKDYFGSCVKLNNFIAKHELTGKLTVAQFKAAHAKGEPKEKSAEQQAKADAKARDNAKEAIIDAAKLLRADRGVDKETKAALADIIAMLAGKAKRTKAK